MHPRPAALLLILLVACAQAAPCASPLCGTYFNEAGSVLRVLGAANGTLSGTYTIPTSEGGGTYAAVGAYSSDGIDTALGWTVAWRNGTESLSRVTSWAGSAHAQGKYVTIVAQWHEAREASPAKYWRSTLSGQDSFVESDESLLDRTYGRS